MCSLRKNPHSPVQHRFHPSPGLWYFAWHVATISLLPCNSSGPSVLHSLPLSQSSCSCIARNWEVTRQKLPDFCFFTYILPWLKSVLLYVLLLVLSYDLTQVSYDASFPLSVLSKNFPNLFSQWPVVSWILESLYQRGLSLFSTQHLEENYLGFM